MSNRYFRDKVLTQDARQVLIAGSFNLSSAAAVGTTNFNGLVASVVKSATGEYTVTLTDKYVALKSVQLTYQGANVNTRLICKSADVTSAKTIVINTIINSAGTDSIADVGTACTIHLTLLMRDSSVTH